MRKIAKNTRPPRNFIRAWRKFRGITIEQLAEMIGASTSSVARIETSEQTLSSEVLAAMAMALRCAPTDLLSRAPDGQLDTWSLFDLSPENQLRVADIIRAYKLAEDAGKPVEPPELNPTNGGAKKRRPA